MKKEEAKLKVNFAAERWAAAATAQCCSPPLKVGRCACLFVCVCYQCHLWPGRVPETQRRLPQRHWGRGWVGGRWGGGKPLQGGRRETGEGRAGGGGRGWTGEGWFLFVLMLFRLRGFFFFALTSSWGDGSGDAGLHRLVDMLQVKGRQWTHAKKAAIKKDANNTSAAPTTRLLSPSTPFLSEHHDLSASWSCRTWWRPGIMKLTKLRLLLGVSLNLLINALYATSTVFLWYNNQEGVLRASI